MNSSVSTKPAYTVMLKDKTVYPLDEADGFDLKLKWLEAKKPFTLELGDDVISSTEIKRISRNKLTQADVPNFHQVALPTGRNCKAQYSIQKEINEIAQNEAGQTTDNNPHAWPLFKLISNKRWRLEMYEKLLETGAVWCDDRAKTCACD